MRFALRLKRIVEVKCDLHDATFCVVGIKNAFERFVVVVKCVYDARLVVYREIVLWTVKMTIDGKLNAFTMHVLLFQRKNAYCFVSVFLHFLLFC